MSSEVNPVSLGRVQENDLLTSPFTNTEAHFGNCDWGDIRRPHRDDCLRVGFWNCGGIPLKNKDPKNRFIREWIDQHQFDVIGLSECNVHWRKVAADERLPERTLGWFETLHMSSAYMLNWLPSTPFQVGGVQLWSINKGAHRVMQSGNDSSTMGRWCWTRYRGKNGTTLRVISAYRCVENVDGPLSAWSQQTLFLESKHITTDPREAFVTDIITQLTIWLEQGDQIILGLDLNESIVSAPFTTKLLEIGLLNILTHKHVSPPPSYIRGSTPIDGIYVSVALSASLCGYLSFIGDHRPSWIDIPLRLVFGHTITPPTRARRLRLQDPRTVQRYNEYLHIYVEDHHLWQRATALSLRSDFTHPSFVQEYNAIDSLHTTGMHQAEKQCRKLRMGNKPYCPEYSRLGRMVIVWRLLVKLKSGGSVDSRYLRRQLKFALLSRDMIRSLTLEDLQARLQVAYRELNTFSKQSSTARSTWLEGLAMARAEQSGLTDDQELQALIHREHQRKEARIINSIIKPGQVFGLSLIQISTPQGLQEITDKAEMESHLSNELAQRFHQAASTPFATEPLLSLMGPLGTNTGAQQILQGTFICPPDTDYWTKKLIPHLQYIPEYRTIQSEFLLTMNPTDHTIGWKKMKERTSPGYSSLSFAQFKAATLHPDLCSLDTTLANIPFYSGISPARWQQGIDVMLQKQEGNFNVEKLRAILLYESDFNQNNKRFGHQFMYLAEKYKAMAMEQFGSRKRMSAVDQSLNKCLTFDLWRQFRTPGALCSNDAKSCYDRIVHNFASICLQRMGAPIAPVVSMFSTIQKLNHHIRTVHGISTSSFSGSQWDTPIHGVGQGNGAGPQIWAAVSTPLLNLLRAEACGSSFQSSLSMSKLDFVGYAFVDDTDLVASHYNNFSGPQVVADIQRSLSAWQGAIQASGGAIVPEKSHWYFVDFTWTQGNASYKKVKSTPGILQVHDSTGQLCTLRQLQPSEAERTLGLRLAPDGNMKSQIQHMRSTAVEWSDRIRAGHLSRNLAFQAMLTTILKTLEYPLPVTTLTEDQCNHIMAPILSQCLPAIGVARTMSRKVVYADHQHGGLNIPNLFWLQGYYHIDRLLRFHQSSHLSGSLLRHSSEALRLELGCNGSLFTLPFTIFGHLPCKSWLHHTWCFLDKYNIKLDLPVPEFELVREHDALLIPTFAAMGFTGDELREINKCRMFLKVVLLSDICTGDGKFVTKSSWHGNIDDTRKMIYQWPYQGPLPYSYWTTWQKALRKLCGPSLLLNQPLGKWFSIHARTYLYDEISDRIYTQGPFGVHFYPRMIGRPSRTSVTRFGHKQACAALPSTACPATVEFHRSFLHLTGWASVVPTIPSQAYDFLGYLRHKMPVSATWAFQHCSYIGHFDSFTARCRSTFVDFIAVSDGSYKDLHGTASWRISIRATSDTIVVPGPPQSQSAYRSELTGLYGICLTLWGLQQYFACEVSVEIGCDGLSAIQSCQDTSDTYNPNAAHFDLISATRFLIRQIQSYVTWRHIKGHQDDNPHAELDMWAQYNIQMDLAAKEYWQHTMNSEPELRPNRIYGEVGVVWLNNTKIVNDLNKQLLSYLGSHQIVPYWERRFSWDQAWGNRINWKMLGHTHALVKRSRRIWVVKSTTGVCGVGKMMVLWRFSTDSTCPRCSLPEEDMTHVLRCPQVEATHAWTSKLKSFQTWLAQNYTSPTVVLAICDRLNTWRAGLPFTPLSPNLTSTFQEVILAQDTMGWESFLYGFWILAWESVQAAYLISIKSKMTIKRWITSIIRKLWDIAWDMWDHRNQWLHHKETGQLVVQLHAEISDQYRMGFATLLRKEKALFKSSLVSLLRTSTANKQLWLQRIRSARAQQEHRAQNGTVQYGRERNMMRQWIQHSSRR